MLFGKQISAVKYNNVVYLMKNSILEPNYNVPARIEQVSIMNGNRHFIKLTDYSEFDIIVYVGKTDDINYLLDLQGKEVEFKPHLEADYFNTKFFVISAIPYSLKTPDLFDMVRMKVKSVSGTYLIIYDSIVPTKEIPV